ncbi:MAG: hypothetical protein ABSG73_12875 [Candidatus Aminicenantales bacterium]
MKKTTALLFVLIFAGLSLYFFFAEDYCHVHNPMPGGTFSHSHGYAASICLCFWSNLFSPGAFDFSGFQGVERLRVDPFDRSPVKAFNADIAHPPKSFLS